ncbi:hypothetical protein ACJZ2D_004706 [Fusarium nematophilum]
MNWASQSATDITQCINNGMDQHDYAHLLHVLFELNSVTETQFSQTCRESQWLLRTTSSQRTPTILGTSSSRAEDPNHRKQQTWLLSQRLEARIGRRQHRSLVRGRQERVQVILSDDRVHRTSLHIGDPGRVGNVDVLTKTSRGVAGQAGVDWLADDKLVLVLSDNGPPFVSSKTTLYDTGVRLPFSIGPGWANFGLTKDLQVLDVADLFYPSPILRLFRTARTAADALHADSTTKYCRMCRSLLRECAGQNRPACIEELHLPAASNLEEDPDEIHNLAGRT